MKTNARFNNSEKIEGYVFSTGTGFNQLSERVSGENSKNPGTKYIAGDLDIAVDEEGLNVITVHFRYQAETTSSGKTNSTYAVLKKIIENADTRTWLNGGKENAFKVSCSNVSIAVNDFIGSDGKNVAALRNENGFCSFVDTLSPEHQRNTFTVDMLINKVSEIEADPEKGIEKPYAAVSGAVFGYGNPPVFIPITLVVKNEKGIKHFMDLEPSNGNPVFSKVWGRINCKTKREERVEESAFGEAAVQVFERKTREYEITGAAMVPYDFGDPEVLTIDDVNTMIQNRQIMLAEVQKRHDERKTAKTSGGDSAFNPVAQIPTGGFTF